jgi:TRAP-type C4-dicarboxylate transport system substrate-binding protein
MKITSIRRKNVAFGFVLFIVLVWAALPDLSQAQGKVEYKWRFGSPWTQKIRNESISLFCDLVNKYSNGRIQIRFQHSGLLGTHDEIFHAVREGSIEMGSFSPYVNLVPGGTVNWMPWTITSYDEAALAYNPDKGILFKVMDDAYEEVGFKLLWNSYGGGAFGIGNRVRPIKTPDDFRNLKIRVSGSLGYVRTLENMGKGTGMTLQTIPWADVYNALQTGVVDGCWAQYATLLEMRHFEVIKYFTELNWAWDAQNMAMNRKLWDKIPQNLKDAIMKAGREAEERDSEAYKKANGEYKKQLEASGLQIYVPTPAEREVFRQKANMPEVWREVATPWLDKRYPGQNMTQKIRDELEKIHRSVKH